VVGPYRVVIIAAVWYGIGDGIEIYKGSAVEDELDVACTVSDDLP
jgi:hypothetical protein